MAFTDGLDHWQLGGTFLRQGTGFHDYSATAEDGRAILAAAVPEPAGFAFLAQEIEPDDYRGRAVTFRGELRTARRTAAPGWRSASPAQAARAPGQPAQIPGKTRPTTSPPPPEPATWTQYEVTAQIPADASLIRFGVFLNGGGQVELRHPQLDPYPANQ